MNTNIYCWRQCCLKTNTLAVIKLIPAYIGNSKQQIFKYTIKSDENKKEKLSKNQASQILLTRCFGSCPVLLFTKNYDNSIAFWELCSQDVLLEKFPKRPCHCHKLYSSFKIQNQRFQHQNNWPFFWARFSFLFVFQVIAWNKQNLCHQKVCRHEYVYDYSHTKNSPNETIQKSYTMAV